jgi:hypothetical protein
VAQLDYVHSVLRLNYETLKGLISLASPSVAKTTVCETRGACALMRITSGLPVTRELSHGKRYGPQPSKHWRFFVTPTMKGLTESAQTRRVD